jgi:hypothetical protein
MSGRQSFHDGGTSVPQIPPSRKFPRPANSPSPEKPTPSPPFYLLAHFGNGALPGLSLAARPTVLNLPTLGRAVREAGKIMVN